MCVAVILCRHEMASSAKGEKQEVNYGTTRSDDAWGLAALRRGAARPSVAEDDDAVRAPVAGVPLSGSQPARSAAADASAEFRRQGEKEKSKKREKCKIRHPIRIESAGFCSGNWLAALDDFRNWLIREAA